MLLDVKTDSVMVMVVVVILWAECRHAQDAVRLVLYKEAAAMRNVRNDHDVRFKGTGHLMLAL